MLEVRCVFANKLRDKHMEKELLAIKLGGFCHEPVSETCVLRSQHFIRVQCTCIHINNALMCHLLFSSCVFCFQQQQNAYSYDAIM